MADTAEKQPFDTILENHFPKDIQQKRIRKELISLNELDQEFYKVSLQNTTLGLKIIVELSTQFVEFEVEQSSKLKLPVTFELLLDPQFPFNLPKLFSKTNIYDPSLADARDFLEDVIERSWSPTILLKEVITLTPKFLKRLSELKEPLESQLMGRYHVGDLYSLEDLLGLESITLFSGEELDEGKDVASSRYLMIAESFFLKFEPMEKARSVLKLITWANVQSIANIKKSKEEDKLIVLTFIAKEKKSGFAQSKFKLNDAKKFIDLIIEKGDKYGVKVSKAVTSGLSSSQYTSKSGLKDEPIEKILENISALEYQLESDISKDNVYTLMALYQKVVEHFAVFDDPMVEDFVQRLRSLMERQDVQTSLKENEAHGNHEENAHEKSQDTDIDDNNNDEEEEEKNVQGEKPFSNAGQKQYYEEKKEEIVNNNDFDDFNEAGVPGHETFHPIESNKADEKQTEENVVHETKEVHHNNKSQEQLKKEDAAHGEHENEQKAPSSDGEIQRVEVSPREEATHEKETNNHPEHKEEQTHYHENKQDPHGEEKVEADHQEDKTAHDEGH